MSVLATSFPSFWHQSLVLFPCMHYSVLSLFLSLNHFFLISCTMPSKCCSAARGQWSQGAAVTARCRNCVWAFCILDSLREQSVLSVPHHPSGRFWNKIQKHSSTTVRGKAAIPPAACWRKRLLLASHPCSAKKCGGL